MMFSSVEFLFFFPVVFVLYWLVGRTAKAQNALLLLASYVFYASWSPRILAVLLVSTAVDYLAGLFLEKHRASPPQARLLLALSILFNVGLLGFFKYEGFFAESLNRLMSGVGLGMQLPVLKLILPLGISFYTFQKIGYVVDVYYERTPACRSPLTFATFVAFFPQLIAGPIVRAADLLPQYEERRALSAEKIASGAGVFFLGFIKKAYIADYLAQFVVDPMFASPERFSRAGHWVALLGYGVQVFCDFSGYSEMAIGTARTLGIELPVNFNYPFLSKSLLEFWRRWHITLNTWLFDYIYTPLTTGESWMRGRLELGFMIVFLASGFWHGAAWTFVAWGVLHGIALVVHHRWDVFYRGLCRKDRAYVAWRKTAIYGLAAWSLTQGFLLTLVPFRAKSLGAAWDFAKGLVVSNPGALLPTDLIPPLRSMNLAICLAFFFAYHLLELDPGKLGLRSRMLSIHPVARGVVYSLVIAFLLIFLPLSSSSFVYAQF